jgi:bifunctional DNA-binding transcriptional regulator/antitoxin component of YhaV-PrlF toxin-antitoxin module
MYATTINQNGMILLNKSAREALGLKLGDRVVINFNRKVATVERELTDDEFFAKLDAIKSDKTKKSIKTNAGKSASELFELAMQKTATSNSTEEV